MINIRFSYVWRHKGFRDVVFVLPQENSLLLGSVFDPPHRWQEAGFWDDPCVRIGWVQGIRAMLQHPPALHFLVESGKHPFMFSEVIKKFEPRFG